VTWLVPELDCGAADDDSPPPDADVPPDDVPELDVPELDDAAPDDVPEPEDGLVTADAADVAAGRS
jgi:hypothetical protein